jgi:hypothetical protein
MQPKFARISARCLGAFGLRDRRQPPSTFGFLTASSFSGIAQVSRLRGERLPLSIWLNPDLGDWKGGRDDAMVGSES